MKLVIGNQNYSSWSLRPWILLKQFNIDFEQHRIALFTDDMLTQMSEFCPNNRVPVLIDHNQKIWDSLAICEYINEQYLCNEALPKNPIERAKARSICAEMHANFPALRHEMPMNCRRLPSKISYSAECQNDIDRIIDIWSECLQQNDGEFLFGKFSLADAYYMPVASRFNTYLVDVPPQISEYIDTLMSLNSYQEWLAAAKEEQEVIECEEV